MNTNKYNIVCFGEVLWDILPSGPAPGGAPVNVAYHLKKLGHCPCIITRLGSDPQGVKLQAALESHHIDTSYIQKDQRYPTGIVHAIPGKDHNMTYEIAQPAAWDFIELEKRHKTLMAEAEYFVFGSLAARSVISRATLFSLLEMAAKKVLDINLRAPHFNKELILSLLSRADILKLNEDELYIISSWFSNQNPTTLEDCIDLLQERFQTPTIIVTCGANGAIVKQDGTYFRHPGFKVDVQDTVGSGDAFLAAFLCKTIAGSPPNEALAYSCAVGAAVASKTGAWVNYQPGAITQRIQ